MIKVGLIGAGKMGLSHYAILGARDDVQIAAVCDSAGYVTSALRKYTGVSTFSNHRNMLEGANLDAVVVSTPSSTHFAIASDALTRGLHVFVEKPLCLDPNESAQLAKHAVSSGRANQVGYHNRFIGTFREARRLVRTGALGEVYHISGSAFGQVVVRPKASSTWRSRKSEGGGCLHDYASHVIDLMNFVVGSPERVLSAQLRRVYSRDVEDAVYAMLQYPGGVSGQLETNWSDDSFRKMTTTLSIYGTKGKVVADRQECRVYLHPGAEFERYASGWTIRNITDLQPAVAFYLRGEEYTAQLDAFLDLVNGKSTESENTFASASVTDRTIGDIAAAA